MKPALRLLLSLFTILCSITISSASIQESRVGVVFEEACVNDGKIGFLADFNAPKSIANPVPGRMARVIPEGLDTKTVGAPWADDVFVTAADDIAGLNSQQIARRLTIPESPTGFRVVEFPTPKTGVASPINITDPGFIGGGRTAGGAREFVIPNQPIPRGSTTRSAN